MPRIQIADVEPFAGIGKASNKPYNAVKVKGIVTQDDGSIELGQMTFFESSRYPLPRVVKGQHYEPVTVFEAVKGELVPRLVGLNAVAVASVPKAA